jgi:hypothetical protein
MTNDEQFDNLQNGAVDVYKKWRQSSGEGGFINFQYWPVYHKVIVDIGTVKNGALVDNAKCFVNASQFMAYLKADVEGIVTKLFPNFFDETAKKAGWATYGGSTVQGKVIARVFKVTYWPGDQASRDFKCAWFDGQPMGQGAIQPIYDKPIKTEHIKMTMFELAELYQEMSMAVLTNKIHNKLEKLVFEDA